MRPQVAWAFRTVAILAAVLTTVQPFLGSFSLFRADGVDYEQIHLVVAGIIYNLTILVFALTLFARFRRRGIILGVCLVQYGLLHLQLHLGLESNNDPGLLAFHIPVGVLIFLIAYVTVALGFGARMEAQQA
jgi:hypothetical protein